MRVGSRGRLYLIYLSQSRPQISGRLPLFCIVSAPGGSDEINTHTFSIEFVAFFLPLLVSAFYRGVSFRHAAGRFDERMMRGNLLHACMIRDRLKLKRIRSVANCKLLYKTTEPGIRTLRRLSSRIPYSPLPSPGQVNRERDARGFI